MRRLFVAGTCWAWDGASVRPMTFAGGGWIVDEETLGLGLGGSRWLCPPHAKEAKGLGPSTSPG